MNVTMTLMERILSRLLGREFRVRDESEDGTYVLHGYQWRGHMYIHDGEWIQKE